MPQKFLTEVCRRMKIDKTLNCYIVGEHQLLVECADILLKSGFNVLGVISNLPKVIEWAADRNLPCMDIKQAEISLINDEFDYLFSIISPYILPISLIKRAKKLAINYHDAPLPRYAGGHATSWAILNDESEHGISWHLMTEKIDAGDILKQKKITIEKGETAFSLNLKCYKAALVGFRELVSELSDDSYVKIPQDMSARIYHNIHQKIPGSGWISWGNSAESIDRVVRALNVGQYKNRLGLAKFVFDENSYVVNRVIILEKKSDVLPGTIINISDDGVEVATETKNILLSDIDFLNKDTEFGIDRKGILDDFKKGDRLYSPKQFELDEFERLSTDCSKHEDFWVKNILEYKPATLPFLPLKVSKDHESIVSVLEFSVENPVFLELKKIFINTASIELILLSCWMTYLYLLGNKACLGLTLRSNNNKNNLNSFESLIESHLPVSVEFNDEMIFEEVLEAVSREYNAINSKGVYLKDLQFRYPELSERHRCMLGEVIIGKTSESESKIKNSQAIFFILIDEKNIKLRVREEVLNIDPYFCNFIKNVPEHFEQLLRSIALQKDSKISELIIISEREKQNILVDWNKTDTPITSNSVYELFQKQVEKTPDNLAIYHEGRILSYCNLSEKINQLSKYLHNIGVKKPSIVGVFADSGPEVVIAFLALLKIGVTYVPLDPLYAACNIDLVIRDCQIQILLTDKKNKVRLDNLIVENRLSVNIINLEDPKVFSDSQIYDPGVSYSHTEDPAYILYTSGTTGAAKGVIIRQKSIINLALAIINALEFSQDTRVLQFSSIAFDASVLEIYSTLFSGGGVYIPLKGKFLVGRYLEDYILNHNINILLLPPPILSTLSTEKKYPIQTLIVGGEACNFELAKKWFDKYKLINAYGPTEATVCVTLGEINEKQKLHISIGSPINNTRIYVLGENLELLPMGVIGELYVAGEGLAVGYKNQLELTKEKFIKVPSVEEKTLYKTGDLVRWLPNGTLEYMGRKDNQVKIRGFRIELEAVRLALLKYENVSECAVNVFCDSKKLKHLVAYMVLKNEKNIDNYHLKRFIGHILPSYMIPSFFVCLKGMPLTSSGKINYRALPLPDLQERFSRADYVASETDFEKDVEKIWSDLLRIKKIGMRDDFFDLGGYSLLLTEMIVKVEEKLKFSFSLHTFLTSPTIENLSKQFSERYKVVTPIYNYNFINDTELSLDFDVDSLIKAPELNFILLTGATGFLGSHLLSDLCRSTDAIIVCLVRAETEETCFVRLQETVKKYKLKVDWSRILSLKGDLEKPCLDLQQSIFLELAKKIDAIYHCGASVHHLYGYDKLRPANVQGTVELLKLATTAKMKKFHYISTLSAVDAFLNQNGSIHEDFIDSDNPSYYPKVQNGYNLTKWVCERLLYKAKLKGVPIKIYRPGWVMGKSDSGICHLHGQHLFMLIKSCVQTGYAPDWHLKLNMVPVDFASKVITAVSLHKETPHHIFNLRCSNHITWVELINWMNNNGFSIKLINPSEWREKHLIRVSTDNALFPLLSFYLDKDNRFFDKTTNEHDSHFSGAEVTHVEEILRILNIPFLKIDEALLRIYFNFLAESGFLNCNKEHYAYGEDANYV